MHILIASLYATVMWLSVVAVFIYTDGPALAVLACGPIVVSGVIVALYIAEALIALTRAVVDRVLDQVRECQSIIRGME